MVSGCSPRGPTRPAPPSIFPVSAVTAAPEEERPAVEVVLGPRGEIWCAGEERTLEELKELLYFCGELARDEESPHKPARTGAVLVAGAAAPWRDVQAVMMTCADPAVRIWRVYWLVKDGTGKEGLLDVFLPPDRGLVRDRPDYPRVTVELIRGEADGRTAVRVDGAGIGLCSTASTRSAHA